MNSWNKKHPELRDGEMFLGNADRDEYSYIGHKTKRLGQRAYDIHGNILKNTKLFPVFVQIQEMKEKGLL